MLLRAGFDYKYQGLERYIQGASEYLSENGSLLLGTGNFADIQEIQRIALYYGYSLHLLGKKETPLRDNSTTSNEYRLYDIKK